MIMISRATLLLAFLALVASVGVAEASSHSGHAYPLRGHYSHGHQEFRTRK